MLRNIDAMQQSLTQAAALLSRARRLLSDHRTRAKKVGVRLNYGLVDIRRLLEAQPLCEYCRAPVSFAVTLDHADPISRGGKHALDNLAICCSRCNSMKGMLTEAEFRKLLTFLALLHPVARTDLERRLLAGTSRYAGKRSQRKTTDGSSCGATALDASQSHSGKTPP
jgi:5-methylcytosine-specific restriction endonuclease McrA